MSSGPNCCKILDGAKAEGERQITLFTIERRLARSARNFRQVFQKRHGKKDARPTNPKSPPGSVRKVFSTPGHEDSKTKLLNGEQKSCLTSQRCDTPIHTRDSGSDHRTNSEQRTSFTESRCCCAENCESNNKRKAWRARKKNPRTKPGVLRYRSRSKGEQRRRRSPSSDNSKSSVIVLYSAHRPALESSPSSSFSASLKSGARAPAKPARSASIDSRGSPSLPLGSRAAASAARAETATLPSRSRRGTRSRKDEGRGGAAGSRRREDRPGGDRVGRVSGTVDAPRGPAPAANAKRQERRLSRNRSGRQRGGGGDGVLGEDAPCWRPVDSELMAQHFNSQSKSLQQQQRQRPENSDPTYGLLMQHLHGKQHSKATSNSPNSLASNDSQRIFPFQATPSGNLKIIPNQVVFESKKVSVLVSDPRHAKVSVKTERGPESHAATTGPAYQQQQQPPPPPRLPAGSSAELPPGVTSSTIERLQAQRRLPLHPEPGQECRPCTQPVNRTRAEQSQQQPAQRSTTCAGKVLDSVPLSTLGFTSKQPINWKNIVLPEKTDLYIELARRITTYKNADCIVRIDNDEFHCHLLVLQSYSTFFDDKNVKRIDLTGNSVTSEAFSIIYDWMISSTSESCHLLRRDNILEIFLAAQQLGIKELEEQCWAFIDNDELFSEDTAFLLYLEARKIGNTAVMELMVPRIMKFFLMLVSTKDFLELSTEELCLLLRSNYICVNSEMEVLMSAVRWLMHDWEVRKEHLLEVMKCVRFGLIAPWQLVDVKRNPENPEFMELISYPEIQKMVDDGLAFVIIKYWYGNQTEDYYHWIDLLGLTEPTNRNWAGEDKHYVTYKEFLLYLEEYQRLKVEEFRNRKFQIKPSPPNSPPKEDFSPQPTSQPKARNHAGRVAEIVSTMSNIRPSRHSVDLAGNNVTSAGPPSTMMSPEILSQYLGSIGRNGTKTMTDSSGMCNQLSTNSHNTKMLGNASDFAPIFSETKSQSDAKKIKKSTKKSKKDRGENILFPGSRYLQSKNTLISTLSKFKKKFSDATYVGQQSQSLMSEEEAATKIQAMYRGYKARRNYKMISENSVKNTQSTKRTHDFGLNSVRKNLNKSLEPVRKPSNSDKGDPNKSEDKNNSLKSGEAVEDIVVQEENQKKDNHVEAISKNLQKIQLVEEKSNETSTASSLIETIMPPSYTNAISEKESSTSVSIRSILTPSYDSSSLLNKHRFTMSDSNKIQNNKISGKRKLFQTRSELQTRRKTKKIGLTKFMKCKPLYVISNSNRTLDFTN